jgi:hypothetical protein
VEEKDNCSVFKRGNSVHVSYYRPASPLNNISKTFEFVVHGLVSHYLRFKLNLFKQSITKSKSSFSNLLTYLDITIPLVDFQRQVDIKYYDLSIEFDLGFHTLLLQKLSALGLLMVM